MANLDITPPPSPPPLAFIAYSILQLTACDFIFQMMKAGRVWVWGSAAWYCWCSVSIPSYHLSPQDIFYSHRSFQRPHLQVHPHHSFEEEVRTRSLSSQPFLLSCPLFDHLQCAVKSRHWEALGMRLESYYMRLTFCRYNISWKFEIAFATWNFAVLILAPLSQ